jgi:hypothetical protein
LLASEIEQRIQEWLNKNAVQKDGDWKCGRCGDDLWGEGKRLSVHEFFTMMHTHGGGGEVREIVFPYCRKCDKGIAYFEAINCIDY